MREDRPSSTALVVALGVLAFSRREQGHALVDKEDGHVLRETLRRLGGLPRLLSMNWPPAFASIIEQLFVPGIITHFGLRKRLIREAVVTAISDGFSQVVVIGAGLDTLTFNLARANTAAALIEIDHPATQRAKQAMLEVARVDPKRISLLPADLATTSLKDVLAGSPQYNVALPTVFVAEGLTMYLTDSQVRTLLSDIAASARRARLLMTFMNPDARGRTRFTRQSIGLRILLRLFGEPFHWGSSEDALAALLNQHNWTLSRVNGPIEFAACAARAGLRFDPTKFVGEFLAEAQRDANETAV